VIPSINHRLILETEDVIYLFPNDQPNKMDLYWYAFKKDKSVKVIAEDMSHKSTLIVRKGQLMEILRLDKNSTDFLPELSRTKEFV